MDKDKYVSSNDIYNSKTVAIPVPEKNIGIDVNSDFYKNIIAANKTDQIDMSQIESFTNISQSRDQLYTLLDSMAQDNKVAAVLDTYVEDVTERNAQGRILWAESSNGTISKFINFLIDSMNIENNIHQWVYSLITYGDLYLRLFRKSQYEDKFTEDDKKKKLNEDIKLKAFQSNDNYTHYIEAVDNPAEMFELTRYGKTYAYVKAPVLVSSSQQLQNDIDYYGSIGNLYKYKFRRSDITIFEATEFVHASIREGTNRTPETVDIFLSDEDFESGNNAYQYTVRKGQSILYNAYKIWRELSLLENSLLLNRLTQSSIIRVIGVEVGDLPKEQVGLHLQNLKNLIEQKSSLQESIKMTEYNNPGPTVNNIYTPTHNGVGSISSQQIGGDVDIKSLGDIDYFLDLFYGALRVPKQFFANTGDSTGFNGGTSLTLISSRYAKTVKRIQQAIINAITDAVNLMLIDKGLDSYVNKFSIKMQDPATQEEIDKQNQQSTRVQAASDVMSLVSQYIQDETTNIKILKSLLSNAITNEEVVSLVQDVVDKSEANDGELDQIAGDDDMPLGDLGGGGGFSGGGSLNDMASGDFGGETTDIGGEDTGGGELPSMNELGGGNVDFATGEGM